MAKEIIYFRDLGRMDYQEAWDLQESLLQEAVKAKMLCRTDPATAGAVTKHHLLFVEHPSVYTLGKSGHAENVLINAAEMDARGIQFFNTNRGGDITFHGAGQIVGYPVLDLEKFSTDIGRYLRNLEEVVILTLAESGIRGERSAGETGVWIDVGQAGRERKICAIGVRCSRWVTMHGFALNVNTDLSYFDHIIPCGIQNKQVTSIQREQGAPVDAEQVKESLKRNFEKVFDAMIENDRPMMQSPRPQSEIA